MREIGNRSCCHGWQHRVHDVNGLAIGTIWLADYPPLFNVVDFCLSEWAIEPAMQTMEENEAEQEKAITSRAVDVGCCRRYASTLQPGADGHNVEEASNTRKGAAYKAVPLAQLGGEI